MSITLTFVTLIAGRSVEKFLLVFWPLALLITLLSLVSILYVDVCVSIDMM